MAKGANEVGKEEGSFLVTLHEIFTGRRRDGKDQGPNLGPNDELAANGCHDGAR